MYNNQDFRRQIRKKMRSGSCYVPHKADDAEYTRSCITVMRQVGKLLATGKVIQWLLQIHGNSKR